MNILEIGTIYIVEGYLAVFDGKNFECLLKKQTISTNQDSVQTAFTILDFKGSVYMPERFTTLVNRLNKLK